MHLNRLRLGELLALIGSVALLVLLFLHWFEPRRVGALSLPGQTQLPSPAGGQADHTIRTLTGDLAQSGWSSIGWFGAFLLALTIVVALLWLFATVTRQSPSLPVAGEVITSVLGVVSAFVVLGRLIFQPALGLGLANDQVTALAPAYLGLLAALLIAAGAIVATKDERLGAPGTARPEIERRPLPDV